MNRRQLRILIDKLKRKFRFRSGLNFRRKRVRVRGEQVRFYGIWAAEILAVILLAFLLTRGFGMRVVCSGESMETTIPENSSLWVNRIVYKVSDPKKGDIIAFLPRGNANASYSVKRVIGIPGDTILIQNDKLYVNEQVIPLKGEQTGIREEGRAATEITLGEDEFFVLGDNVNNSEDSRYETVGNVKRGDIYGKVWFITSFHGFGSVD
ncbi:MAG: signal peptidase I [Lachnospiraceae bacterium]|nr:signal peptidase I [Lachnospiraceae bacterium]